MQTHFMVDIETFGTRSDAAIVSVGAVGFVPSLDLIREIEEGDFSNIVQFQTNVAFDPRASVSQGTIEWWLKQSEGARKALIESEKVSEKVAMEKLETFIGHTDGDIFSAATPVKKRTVWANGIAFDIPIIESALIRQGWDPEELPWKFWNVRDSRTLTNMAKTRFHSRKHLTWLEEHNSVHDCIVQVYDLMKAVRKYRIPIQDLM